MFHLQQVVLEITGIPVILLEYVLPGRYTAEPWCSKIDHELGGIQQLA